MSEKNPNRKKNGFSSLLLSNFHLLFSFTISHPFYVSYILFFSPYIFKILSFLSPLFVTTTLLLLALLSTLHVHDTSLDSESLETHQSFLFSFCSNLGSVLEHKFDVNNVEFKSLEELEAYNMIVKAYAMEFVSKNESMEITFVDKFCSHEISTVSEAFTGETHEEQVEIQPLKHLIDLEKQETEKCEKEEEKIKPKSVIFLDNREQPTKVESNAQKVEVVVDCNDESYDLPKLSDFLGEEKKNEATKKEEEEEDVALKSFGSMRKEKEWRRTLACKLFEERHNGDIGEQGMDQLWETYETETEKKQTKEEKKKKKKMKKEIVMEEEEEEDVIDQEQLCCLQALKFSTSKIHFGIARPNLLKLSKAFKGFGKFYNATKHLKKSSSN